ncbi:hypothetical protein A3A84_00340 [Candidatus Collierbacteria bacterium RIFCSPLOWO2_01_FULL_50_23]|uniref:Helix-turn-helix domain-containing protein n=2 Tax=Candidatus Collieribacteriota TaxID=1752725 RepID=A0A1F5ES05_9BACT|nr:MAG: hypothetical protein A3D09_03445 [Candidatus Collierbacteria bacterium RIFCSPHIGHO2_02_FULL_49_10]OGD71402.1 MAG: hypothetical protein A2703_04010 [Candidatus Collierbacteria bacterium RIFCSPHIGHO2_01_FULL_50_25]OGD74080.1 MAG: hypothetical protein A3A84_00340 [Candidatus Collierbacteria bacterium RIFCSPLOWO2_01_FULL_50_23]
MTFKTEDLYSVKQVAEKFGVTDRTVWRLVEKEQLPYTRVGNQVRFLGEHMNNYLNSQGTASYQAPSQPTPSYEAGQPLTSNKDGR